MISNKITTADYESNIGKKYKACYEILYDFRYVNEEIDLIIENLSNGGVTS